MNATELLNITVEHKVYGTGIIIEVEDNYITVKFVTKTSKFPYPNAFERFLVAQDKSIQTSISLEIEVKKQAAAENQHIVELACKTENERPNTEKNIVSSTKNTKSVDDGFGTDYNVKHLAKQPILTYQQVEEQFGIKIAGFGRGINRTPSTVVLISSIDKKKTGFVYHDHWTPEGDYIYSGEGKSGNQKLTLGNKAIIDAQNDGRNIHLFVKFSPQEYYYQGVFSLVYYSYEDEKDELGIIRKEYKFRLRKQSTES